MGKTIFAAVVAAIFSSIATVLVMGTFQAERTASDAEARRLAEETDRIEKDRMERRILDMEKRVAAQPRAERRGSNEPPATASSPTASTVAAGTSLDPDPAGGPAMAPDGTPYVSRAELEKYAKDHPVGRPFENAEAVKPVERKSLEDIARDMGLSAAEEAGLRNILRESEEEVIHSLFGDQSLADVKQQAQDAKEDADKQQAFVQGIAMHAMGNAGKLLTNQNRMKKKVKNLLGEDRAAKFLAQPRKPVMDPEFEEILKEGFGD